MARNASGFGGVPWSRGGKYKGKNKLAIDSTLFSGLLQKIEEIGGNVDKAVTDALQQAAETVHDDTIQALRSSNLPAGGKYRQEPSKTIDSVVNDMHVRKDSDAYWVPIGFDFLKSGAGGYLISGTPRMQPVPDLRKMYRTKKYSLELQKDMWDVVSDYVTGAVK